MLDFIGTIVAAAAIAVLLAGVVSTVPVRLGWRLTLAMVIGTWVGVAVAVAAAGQLAYVIVLGIMVAFPLAATGGLALAFPATRSMLLAIPMPLIIGLNVMRVLGVLFLALASTGRLGGPFPLSAGWGDILTGVLAIPVAGLAARAPGSYRRIIAAWNTFGVLDLIVALTLGVTSSNGSPLQLIHAGAGSAALQTLPWSLIPTVLVPLYLIGHAIVFAQLLARASREHKVFNASRVFVSSG